MDVRKKCFFRKKNIFSKLNQISYKGFSPIHWKSRNHSQFGSLIYCLNCVVITCWLHIHLLSHLRLSDSPVQHEWESSPGRNFCFHFVLEVKPRWWTKCRSPTYVSTEKNLCCELLNKICFCSVSLYNNFLIQ